MNDHQHKHEANQQDDSSKIYFTENSTLQTPEEEQADHQRTHEADEDRIETHTTEEVDMDAIAMSDRAGTNERKP